MKQTILAFLLVCASFTAFGQQAQGDKFLADRHVARGQQCAACHGQNAPSAALPLDADKHQTCVKCHGFYDAVAKKTQPADPEEMNPHSQHDGNLPCTECHQGHKASVNYCAQCHFYTFKVP